MMKFSEIAELMILISSADTRFPAPLPPRETPGGWEIDPRVRAWQTILGDTRREDAQEAVMRLVRKEMLQVVQPGHILAEVKKLRGERIARIDNSRLEPPRWEGESRYLDWVRAVHRAVGDGLSQEQAVELARVETGGFLIEA